MTAPAAPDASLTALDEATRRLVLVSAAVCGGDEPAVRSALTDARDAGVPAVWVEEAILQAHLFAGFPRALSAMREWRRISGLGAPAEDAGSPADVVAEGGRACAQVYGPFYAPLRRNVAALHPALDRWMVAHGYGDVLARPGLDLARRELCVVAACASQGQDRQLHAHLHGALNAGASPAAVAATLDAIGPRLAPHHGHRVALLWRRVRDGRAEAAAPNDPT